MMKLRILLIASYLFPLGFGIPLGLDLLFPQTILEASTVTVTVTEPLPSCVTCLNPSSTSDLPELTGPAPTTLGVDGTVVAAYYADWASAILPPEDVDFKRFNWIDFAFAIPDQSYSLQFTEADSEKTLRRLVTTAHANGGHVKLSIGGWSGSKYFSSAVSTPATRATFSDSIVTTYSKFNLDGIDIDWEYPGGGGVEGNESSPKDSDNFLRLLRLLRMKLPPIARITVAAQLWPFAGTDGRPMRDVSAFGEVLDWVVLMNYDVSSTGPNAPLSDGCKNSTQPLANAQSGIQSWMEAGIPARKLVLGLPAYGYVSSTRVRRSRPAAAPVKITSEGGGQVRFKELVRQGALLRNSGGGYEGAGGFDRNWDECSKTPWLRSGEQIISYDDPESMETKGKLCKEIGILGVNLFAADGDNQWDLIDSARRGLGV